VPPVRSLASPMAEAVTSIRSPVRMKAGRSAVTMTAATSLVCSCEASAWVLILSRPSMPTRDCLVKTAFCRLSPVLLRPTTRP
jgi:hypothetical protein